MFARYWEVGGRGEATLTFDAGRISSHLLRDWIPSLSVSLSRALIGWPPFLTEPISLKGSVYLALREEAGRSERQWKSVVSWMLGIAGTREVLRVEGYRWIAPVSAFYSDAQQVVDIADWPTRLAPSALLAQRAAGSTARHRPDYVAIRSTRQDDWAVAESKGTKWALDKLNKCPPTWYRQVRNIRFRLNGRQIDVPRHIVVATRVNPNAIRSATRRIQIRAWNTNEGPSALPRYAAIEIVSAHLFGLFRNLALVENARALAFSSQVRSEHRASSQHEHQTDTDTMRRLSEQARSELAARTTPLPGAVRGKDWITSFETDFGPIAVEVDRATLSLAQSLQSTVDPDELSDALQQTEDRLDQRAAEQQSDQGLDVNLADGVGVRFPPAFKLASATPSRS